MALNPNTVLVEEPQPAAPRSRIAELFQALQRPSRQVGASVEEFVSRNLPLKPFQPSIIARTIKPLEPLEPVLSFIPPFQRAEAKVRGAVAGEVARTATNPVDLAILFGLPHLAGGRLVRAAGGAALGAASALGEEGIQPRDVATKAGILGVLSALPGGRRAATVPGITARPSPPSPELQLIPPKPISPTEASRSVREAYATFVTPQAAAQAATQAQGRAERVGKVVEALRSAPAIRGQQERLQSQELSRRLGRLLGVRERVGGEAGFRAELAQLRGDLPKAEFASLRPSLTQRDVDGLFDDLNAADLGPWDILHAKAGLSKLLGIEGGSVPTRNELDLLRKVFGPELVSEVLKKRTVGQKIGDFAIEAINLPRALMASFDLSAPLRQGLFLIGKPKEWSGAIVPMLKSFASERAFQQVQSEIVRRPTFGAMRTASLTMTELGTGFTTREEAFMSRLGERIPVVGLGVRASNRAYVGFLNKLRADVFDDLFSKGKTLGVADDPHFLKSLGQFINAATGRGPLKLGPLDFERSAVALNSLLFSPRLVMSRLTLLNPAFYVGLHPTVRKEALRSAVVLAGAGSTILSLAKLNGADVVDDPANADFGKLKVGNTRYDLWGGFQQPLRAAYQLVSGRQVSSTTGREFTLGEGYRPTTRGDILLRFLSSKQSPVVSFIRTLLEGERFGQPVDIPSEVVERFIPMAISDAFDIMQERGLGAWWMALPAVVGVGVQTYGKNIPQLTRTPSGRPKVAFRPVPGLAETLTNRLTGRRVSNLPKAFHPALEQARRRELREQLVIDNAKRMVLDTGKPMRVGNVVVFLDRGIVKTKRFGRKETPIRTLERLQKLTPQTVLRQ